MSKMPATLVCKLNISRQFKLKYTVITRSDICAPEPAQIQRKLLYLLEQTASISKLSLSVKSRPANGTFGFFRHSSQHSKKPKEPFFCLRTDERTDRQIDNYSNIFYLEKRDIEK